MTVDLDQPEWNNLLAILSQAPWNVANPLIMKIGEQLRAQAQGRPNGPLEGAEDPDTTEWRQRPS